MCALCAATAAAFGPRLATAFQQQVVGGHALDANLRVDGSGFNTASTRNRVSGMQSSRYAPSYSSRAVSGISSTGYNPGRHSSGAVDTRYASGGVSFDTGYGTFTPGRGGGRTDPLRNPQYSALQTGTYIQRAAIPGGGRSPASSRGLTTPRTTYYPAQRSPYAHQPASGLTSTRYSVARRR